MLTLEDFKADYGRMIIRYPKQKDRQSYVDILIQVNYMHIWEECFEYIEHAV